MSDVFLFVCVYVCVSWFGVRHVSFFVVFTSSIGITEIRIILKQFQNKFERLKRPSEKKKIRKMENGLLLLAEYSFGQKQTNPVWIGKQMKMKKHNHKKMLL